MLLPRAYIFFITGLWPIVSMETFLKVTGPKIDLWLVKTIGILLAVIGAVLVFAQINAEVNTPIIILAIGSALLLILIDITYVAKRVISPIYLTDALVELILIGWWILSVASI